jgi:hypothetical protein
MVVVSDTFAPDYVQLKSGAVEEALSDPEFSALKAKYDQLGPAGEPWLKSALTNIVRTISSKDVLEYQAQQDEESKDDQPVSPRAAAEPDETDMWAPLPIDRQSPLYEEALSASESALQTIEGNNGYATAEPDERNGIVLVMRGTIEAIKTGAPSKAAVLHGLLVPLRFIAKKFAESAMGEVAKIGVAKVIEWLISLGINFG